MAPIKKFYSLRAGESLEELKRKRGLDLCELLNELDRIDNEDMSESSPCILELNFNNLSEEDRQAQEQLKKLRGALNKLTPDNFYIQLMEMEDHIPALNSHLLKVFVKQFVEKACDEPFYSLLYAHLCKALQNIELLGVEDENCRSFKHSIVEECYNKFCYNRGSVNWWSANEPTESDLRNLKVKETKKRKKLVGTMRFIGNLFKARIIDLEDVFRYVKKLEDVTNEKSIEALCSLLTTAGKELELSIFQTEYESKWHATWERILLLSKEESRPLRQRFLLMNLLDFMNSGWIPRNPPCVPKTLSEIVAEEPAIQLLEPIASDNVISHEPAVVYAEQEIMKILQSGEDPFTLISAWETDNYRKKKNWFMYALTRAVLRFCIVGNTLDDAKFSNLIELLKKYNNSRQLEVSCVYAVQYIVVVEMGNPIGLLEEICEKLHSSQTISYIAFLDWRENWSKYPVLEIRGKADAQMNLANFFIKLFRESIRPSSRYKSIVKELNSFDLEHFVSMSKLPPEIGKRIKMEEEREKAGLTRK